MEISTRVCLPCYLTRQQTHTSGLFHEVFNRVDNQPADILVDFERATINAIQPLNGNIDVKGCFYHLSSNIWKKIQHLGFQERFQNEADFAIRLKMLAATAFLPPAQVINGFEELTNYLRDHYGEEIEDLLEYFQDSYIGRFRRNAPRHPPLFALELWNMYHRTDDELPRTNNSVEGWHRSFQGHIASCHPVFWKFLNILQREESLIRVKII